MDSDLVSGSLSTVEGSSGITISSLCTYTQKFNELFPYYLSIGMTEEQYWDRDSALVSAYRKADELHTNRKNQELWLQGAYIYDAIVRVSPVLRAFTKKNTKPIPYINEPFAITEKQSEIKNEEKARDTFIKGKKLMEGFVAKTNKNFERK